MYPWGAVLLKVLDKLEDLLLDLFFFDNRLLSDRFLKELFDHLRDRKICRFGDGVERIDITCIYFTRKRICDNWGELRPLCGRVDDRLDPLFCTGFIGFEAGCRVRIHQVAIFFECLFYVAFALFIVTPVRIEALLQFG